MTLSHSHHLGQAQQHNKVMALLVCHCPFLGQNHQTLGVFSPREQKLGFHSLVKRLHQHLRKENPVACDTRALV